MAVAAYNNYIYLKEAVDSILMQDYPSIELIISNDGSTDFKEDEIAEYIEANAKDNIKKVIIKNHESNHGTVHNVNYMCKAASGTFLMIMAADDALYDDTVLSRFVDSFENENKNCYCVCGKIAMCGERLDQVMNVIPSKKEIDILKSGDCKQVFSELAKGAFVPTTSTCYRAEIFKKLGFFDDNCYIIEDYSFHLMMALNNYQFGWVDNLTAARHRDGGVSHGNSRNKSEAYRRYRYDEIYIMGKYVIPYLERAKAVDRGISTKKWKYIKGAYYRDFIRGCKNNEKERDYDKDFLEKNLLHIRIDAFLLGVRSWASHRIYNISKKKCVRDILIIMIIWGAIFSLKTIIDRLCKDDIILQCVNFAYKGCLYIIFLGCIYFILLLMLATLNYFRHMLKNKGRRDECK